MAARSRAPASPARNRITGRIVSIRHRGVRCELEITTASGLFHAQHASGLVDRLGWRAGQHVLLVVPGSTLIVLPQGEAHQ